MGFKHLPQAGGIFDQNPEMLDRFMYIFSKQNEQREREEAQRRRKQGGPSLRGRGLSSRSDY